MARLHRRGLPNELVQICSSKRSNARLEAARECCKQRCYITVTKCLDVRGYACHNYSLPTGGWPALIPDSGLW